jgi:hypothetical protein
MKRVDQETLRACIRGATDVETVPGGLSPVRLPAWTRDQQADPWIQWWSAHTVGVRLVCVTAASRIELVMSVTRMVPPESEHPLFPTSIVATSAGERLASAPITEGPVIHTLPDRSWRHVDGPDVRVTLELGHTETEREVTVWLPHNGHALLRELWADAELRVAPASTSPVWLHHGSSVSHCLEAVDPLGPWPQQAARELGLDLSNLAIAGNAQLDPFVARTIASRPADIITLKLGVNIVNVDSMRRRAFVPALHGFLDLVREGHPTTPIVVLTPISCPAIENTPGPTRKGDDGFYRGTPRDVVPGDGTLTLGVVRELVHDVVAARAARDPHLWGDDGLLLFGHTDSDLLWDGLHPSQAGYDLIASRFVGRVRDEGSPLGSAFARVTS